MSSAINLEYLKNQVRKNIGKKVVVKADKGRNKIITKTGIIENVFPSLFTIKVVNEFDQERTVSYTYTDLLTSTVELQIC
ncbi:Veg family protein [Miniphocaeibacter halophilus]|uniref:Veg family protein n=1 Tax=Miniphocaeibacter halophilus TaxID=2931922 RepID=A0AC61MRN3_9FIRM|nr:Veg family protein [Miniphocaeibacter halophilus]QQK07978.1 Veg family protein [Miniphocaeibacter halophilus]